MKLRKLLIAVPLSVIVLVACQKEASVNANNNAIRLEAPRQQVKTGEVFTVALKNASRNAVAKWSVSPAAGVEIDSVYSKQGNEIYFNQPGTYTITAEVKNISSNCIPTPQWDTCYKNASLLNTLSNTVTVSN